MIELILIIIVVWAVLEARKKAARTQAAGTSARPARSTARPARTSAFAAQAQARPARSGTAMAVVGFVLAGAALAFLAFAVFRNAAPGERALDAYEAENAAEYLENGWILPGDTQEYYYQNVQDTLSYTGATGDAYEEYWQAIAYSQAVRELLFWQVASEVYGAPASEQYAGEMALRVASIELGG